MRNRLIFVGILGIWVATVGLLLVNKTYTGLNKLGQQVAYEDEFTGVEKVIVEPVLKTHIVPISITPWFMQEPYQYPVITIKEEPVPMTEEIVVYKCLTAGGGVYDGPSGKETWYNLPMNRVISNMRRLNLNYAEYNVRADGVRCLGDYVMVAADLSVYPRGSIIETSLGEGIVCDSCEEGNIDIAVEW